MQKFRAISKLRLSNKAAILYNFLLLLTASIQQTIQAVYDSQKYLIANPKGASCCLPMARAAQIFSLIFLVELVVPVITLGFALVMIKNITVQQRQNKRSQVAHFLVVVFVFMAGILSWIVVFLQTKQYLIYTLAANVLIAIEQVVLNFIFLQLYLQTFSRNFIRSTSVLETLQSDENESEVPN